MSCGSQKHTNEASEQNELMGKSKSHFAVLTINEITVKNGRGRKNILHSQVFLRFPFLLFTNTDLLTNLFTKSEYAPRVLLVSVLLNEDKSFTGFEVR